MSLNQNLGLIITIAVLFTIKTEGQYIPGDVYIGTNGYIEYHAGDLPIIIAAPHGGYLTPSTIPDRSCTTCVTQQDLYTEDIAYLLKESVFSVFGKYPHIVINKLHRKKLDANRLLGEAALGNQEAELAWHEFHDFIQDSKDTSISQYGLGLYIDLHAHGHIKQRIEVGYLLSKSELQLSNALLDSLNFQDTSSIKYLSNVQHPSINFSTILRGNGSMGEVLDKYGYPSVPSPSDPAPLPNDAYFQGGYNTVRHGSRDSSIINAIQLELNFDNIRNNHMNRSKFAKSLACVLRSYIDEWYLDLDAWDPGHIVSSTKNAGFGTLRSAMLGANNGDTIYIEQSLIGDTIALTNELISCDGLTVIGAVNSYIHISGSDSTRILSGIAPITDTLSLYGLNLIQGKSPINEDGGAIQAFGNIGINNCKFEFNFSDDDGGALVLKDSISTLIIDSSIFVNNSCSDDGGAISQNNGVIIINASSISNNNANSDGGGVWTSGDFEVFNSTIDHNSANGNGGGIRCVGIGRLLGENITISDNLAGYRGGGISNAGILDLDHATVAYNTSINRGGGIRLVGGSSTSIKNTIISNNTASANNQIYNTNAYIVNQGHNLISDTSGSNIVVNIGDQFGNNNSPLNAQIGILEDNGGITSTIALMVSSPAIDKGSIPPNNSYDQRGLPRLFCDFPDVGSFELHLDTIIWTGAIDSNWFDVNNWQEGVLPSKCNIVKVPDQNNIPNLPILDRGSALCKELYLDNNAVLIQRKGGRLIIRGQ